jgi:pimeloyl-ACP methyl ester carboxylesterase
MTHGLRTPPAVAVRWHNQTAYWGEAMPADRTVSVDGLNVRFLEAGAGPAVILLHGASTGSSGEVFEAFLDRIAAAGYRAIALDQPGYGLTDNPRDFTNSYRVAFITKVMDALAIEQATLVGHSQAGGFVVQAALQQPERVSAVAVVSGGGVIPPLPDAAPAPERGAAPRSATTEPADPTLDEIRTQLEADVFHKELITPDLVAKRHRLSGGKNVVAAAERSRAREPRQEGKPLWERVVDVSQPLVMLYGDHDRAAAAKRAALLKEQQPRLDVRVVKDAAHMLMWDAPDVFLSALLELLARAHTDANQHAAV